MGGDISGVGSRGREMGGGKGDGDGERESGAEGGVWRAFLNIDFD